MSWRTAAEDMQTAFHDEVAVPKGLVVAGDNMPFAMSTAEFASTSIAWGGTAISGTGPAGARCRADGTLLVTLHSTMQRGDKAARELAAFAMEALRSSTFGICETLLEASSVVLGLVGNWWVTQVLVPFVFRFHEPRVAQSAGRHDVESAAAAVRSHFIDAIATPQDLIARYDNQPDLEREDALWCRFSVAQGSGEEEIGRGLTSTVGVAASVILAPLGSGSAAALALADAIASAQRAKTISGIRYGSPTLTRAGRVGPWWQLRLSSPFTFDH